MPNFVAFMIVASVLYTTCFIMTWFQDKFVVGFMLTIAIFFDIVATVKMVQAADGIGKSFHGIVGFPVLAVLIIFWFFGIFRNEGNENHPIARNGKRWYRILYTWWMLSFIAGAIVHLRPV